MTVKKGKYLFSSESVSEGHPDKVADQVSDGILDACLEQDPHSRVAIETLVKTGMCVVAGEVTTKAKLDFGEVARKAIKDIGYDATWKGFDADHVAVLVAVVKQSPDIAQGVNLGEGDDKEQGAGDQGLMFGYACNETPEFMPLPMILAHKLTQRLAEVRKNNSLAYLGPDAKSQVTIEYDSGKPIRADAIVIAAQHAESVSTEQLRKDIREKVVDPICGKWIDANTKFFINATGRFVLGGPAADAGVTGRKIIADTYGGYSRHGGGAFSGKDPTKVDRSAAYMCRYAAKNIVAAGLADKCEIQVAYAIGVSKPVSVLVDTFGTNKVPEETIEKAVSEVFSFKPADIIRDLNLRRPIYRKTAAYGHFGRNEPEFSWEKTDKAELLAQKAGLKASLHA